MARYSIEECEQAMIAEFEKGVKAISSKYQQMSMKELKREILKLEQDYKKNEQQITFFNITLAQVIYRNKFGREVVLGA
ncbi:hypothetical protein [Vagococcus xieshaowenii]|uniref:Uncharacterized protein n=1 Tax=Vagococcus xieshaowenii TaxID=2562451 RepID=A0AAJ5EG02_9ENTE|nr:hypothetical protein [Vagococcus xieshaowenii]QCA28891.1 hypothetical protein E4Z98_05995 [Vagococcus xieshaowenii]TFZ43309.1 hypothetical protein E4031_00365 [Vagococcus xieshaowenii]